MFILDMDPDVDINTIIDRDMDIYFTQTCIHIGCGPTREHIDCSSYIPSLAVLGSTDEIWGHFRTGI